MTGVGQVATLYIMGWYIGGPTRFLNRVGTTPIQTWAGLVLLTSPFISVLLIVLAIWPNTLAALSEKKSLWAKGLLAVIFLFTATWLVNAFLYTPMYNKMMADPMTPVKVMPFTGGMILHMVFQHWFQSAAVLIFALFPEKFSTLTQSSEPAGNQYAVVVCG